VAVPALREVAAELAPPTVRRELHAKVADVLVGAGKPDWQLIAAHYEQADKFDQAAAAYGQACTDARRRGALAEAVAHLTRGLAQVDRATPGPNRDRRETALRMERGFLTSAAEGYQSSEAAADFERCLRLSGNVSDDELFSTLVALANYYLVRADLHRAAQVIKSLQEASDEQQGALPEIEILRAAMAHLRGDLRAAITALDKATAAAAKGHRQGVDVDSGHLYRALVALIRGDFTGAEADLDWSASLAEASGFPEGEYLRAYTRSMETWLRIEAGQLDRAAVLAAEMIVEAERHGFDMWRLVGATWQAAVRGLAAVDHRDLTGLAAHIATFTACLDRLRTTGVNIYTTVLDSVLARLLIAASQSEAARDRVDVGLALAQDTGMCFYDAELLRLRARTHADPAARQAEANLALELARIQAATLFELRCALDYFDLRGEAAAAAVVDAVNRVPANYACPELARARAVVAELRP